MIYGPNSKVQCQDLSDFDNHFSRYVGSTYTTERKLKDSKGKAEWIKALRSGEFMQGKKALKNRYGKFCCLGVKCHIDPRVIKEGFNYWYLDQVDSGVLPALYADELGIEKSGRFVYTFTAFEETFSKVTSLAELNDDDLTFEQIADLIEYFF